MRMLLIIAGAIVLGLFAACDGKKKSDTAKAREQVQKIYEGARRYYVDENKDASPGQAKTPTHKSAWKSLQLQGDGGHYFHYSYDPKNDGGAGFTARARGDLDRDPAPTTFELHGQRRDAGAR